MLFKIEDFSDFTSSKISARASDSIYQCNRASQFALGSGPPVAKIETEPLYIRQRNVSAFDMRVPFYSGQNFDMVAGTYNRFRARRG